MQTITVTELESLSKKQPIELIDVRTPAEFGSVHATIAKNVPLDSLDPEALMSERNGSASQTLYVICKSGTRGSMACKKFIDAGFSNVVNVEGGTSAWEAAGFPVVRGTKKVIALDRQMRIVAGTLILIGVVLGFQIHRYFFGLSAFVGAGLIFAGVTDICPMMNALARMPWNRGQAPMCKV